MKQVQCCGLALVVLAVATGCGGEVSGAAAPYATPSGLVRGLVPAAPLNDEEKLLADAKAAEVVTLEGGYRQVDLVVARVATWDQDRELSIRLFLPPVRDMEGEAKPPALPLVAYVHGGGFIGGSPEMNLSSHGGGFHRPVRALLDEGFAVVSLGYRLAREAGWPAPISDTLCGLRFLARHGEHWGVDASRLGVCGHSAGARVAGLLAMVPQDGFHTQDLPWKGQEVHFAAAWLWAGSAWWAPAVDEWSEFGKPHNYSVARLLFGEHPAWDDNARHLLRLRGNAPHMSGAMPPVHFLRGASDYGGDHTDAERAVEIWQALGIEATLSIVSGGHSAVGPVGPVVDFFARHLRGEPSPRRPDAAATARRLLDLGEPAAVLDVLSAAHTGDDGCTPPAGSWMILHDGRLLWLPRADGWPKEAAALARQAADMLAASEAQAAWRLLEQREWFMAVESVANVRRLKSDDDAMRVLSDTVDARAGHEAALFAALHAANGHVHAGRREEAIRTLLALEDERTGAAAERLRATQAPPAPEWAQAAGLDVYGRWADLRLDADVTIRLRWVEPGVWELPEHLWYRNRTDEPFVRQVRVVHGLWLAETPTTIAQWHALGGESGSGEVGSQPADLPITGVDYLQIVGWLERLSAGRRGFVARLPSEVEWLYAGTLGGRRDVQGPVDRHAIHALNVDPLAPGPVGARNVVPTLGGFYGMLGGVQEWTCSPGRHTARFTDDSGRFRVLSYPIARGGAWSSMPHTLDWSARMQHRHENRQPDLGFRLVIGEEATSADWLSGVERHRQAGPARPKLDETGCGGHVVSRGAYGNPP